MKGLAPLFLGIFGTFAFSWVGLTVIPNWQIGHLNPQSDEEGTDIYPQPQSGMFQRGAHVYAANGCIYCHSQQVRAEYAGADIERGWGNRRSAPRDYIFERPVFLGKMRMGQDIANIGARAPAEQQSPAPPGAASPAASPSGATSPAPSAAPQGAAPAGGSPAAKQSQSPPPLHHPACRSQARRGQSKPLGSLRCIPRHGTMCIFTRRAASTSIRTCRRIGSFTKSAASVTHVRRTLYSSPVPMRHPKAGR